jgi:hypothetical protein
MANAVRVYFSHQGIKLWRNEKTYKRNEGGGSWYAVKDLGYPRGFPDLMGYETGTGIATGCELKTLNDKLKKEQTDKLSMMVNDGLLIYQAHERKDGNIDLLEWKLKGKKIVKEKTVIYV